MKKIDHLKVKIFADGALKNEMLDMHQKTFIKGLTTNPTLMNKAGIKDYRAFCKDILTVIKDKPLSFEVFSDDFSDMERQALEIASWGDNVYVKVPITNTKAEPCYALVKKLANEKVKLNITAIMTLDQVANIVDALDKDVAAYISVFAGRVADTGRDPIPIMQSALHMMREKPLSELIYNIVFLSDILQMLQGELYFLFYSLKHPLLSTDQLNHKTDRHVSQSQNLYSTD